MRTDASTLSSEQFDALVDLTGMHKESATTAALREIFVDGLRPVDAALRHGITAGGLYRRSMELRRKVAKAKIVAGKTL